LDRYAKLGQVRNLSGVLQHFPGQRMLIIGDVILDRYWWGEASRLSPEAPVPVVRKQRCTVRPGGAANTAANLAALSAVPILVGLVGRDGEAAELQAALMECDVAVGSLIAEAGRPTTTKTRGDRFPPAELSAWTKRIRRRSHRQARLLALEGITRRLHVSTRWWCRTTARVS
jgi:hypothetical protein